MQVDLYLRWLLYLELFALFIIFVPYGANIKRSLLLSLAPLFTKIKLVFLFFWSFILFIFGTTFKEVYFSNAVSTNTMDATAKLELARNERDVLLSGITLLLLPIIYVHSKSVLKTYRLQQSLTAMTKQATNASNQLLNLMQQQTNDVDKKKKKKESNKKTDDTDIDMKMLREESLLNEARLQKSDKKCQDLKSELDQLTQQLAQYETMQKVVKKKS